MVTFYNAIANKGKLMKPYIVESVERDGVVETQFEPQALNGAICSEATADTLLRALRTVTAEGTGTRLKKAKCEVAGKTGTAQVSSGSENALFVGFAPADDPKIAVVAVIEHGGNRSIYSKCC